MSTKSNLDAIVEALNAALPTACRAYPLGKVPATRPAEYVEVIVTRRFGGERRQCSRTGAVGYRALIRAVSQVSVDNVLATLETCRLALEFQQLDLDGRTTTPVQFETATAAAPDNGWFSSATTYTYVI